MTGREAPTKRPGRTAPRRLPNGFDALPLVRSYATQDNQGNIIHTRVRRCPDTGIMIQVRMQYGARMVPPCGSRAAPATLDNVPVTVPPARLRKALDGFLLLVVASAEASIQLASWCLVLVVVAGLIAVEVIRALTSGARWAIQWCRVARAYAIMGDCVSPVPRAARWKAGA